MLPKELAGKVFVSGGRGLVGCDVSVGKGVQQVDASEPVRIAPEKSAAHAHRRDARDVGAVGKRRTDHIELVFDAEHANPKRQHVYLTLELAATEDRIALGIDGLFELTIRIATCVERAIAQDAC